MENMERTKPPSDEDLRKLADLILNGMEWFDVGPGSKNIDAEAKYNEYLEVWLDMQQSSQRFTEVCGPMLEDYRTTRAYESAMEKVIRRMNGEFDVTKEREAKEKAAAIMKSTNKWHVSPLKGFMSEELEALYTRGVQNAILQDDWERNLYNHNTNTYSNTNPKKDK